MKKVIFGFCIALATVAAFAQEQAADGAVQQPKQSTEKAAWPVWVTFNSTRDIDVIGLRMTLPYGSCESITGFDVGFFGRCRYFEGFQLNILRNEALDVMAGAQGGIYNSAGRADLTGLQVGFWNEVRSMRGVQVGIINRSEALYGFQGGIVNVIRESEMPFCPILNIGFDTFTEP